MGEALRTPAYWFILMASSLRISVTSGLLVHAIPIMVWKGTTEQTGADFTALLFFVSIPTRLLIGFSGMRLPGQGVLGAGMAVGAVSLLALNLVPGTWIIFPFVAGLAILEGAAVLNWVLVGNLFGRRSFATLTRNNLRVLQRRNDAVASVPGLDGGPQRRLHRVSACAGRPLRRQCRAFHDRPEAPPESGLTES